MRRSGERDGSVEHAGADRGARAARRWVVAGVLLVFLGLTAGLPGCASGKPRKACAKLYASERLNLYDGVSHPITVYIYPLSSSSDFEQTAVVELLEGTVPSGAVAPPVPVTIAPGETRSFQETFPSETRQLGILADFYRAPGDPEGTRTQVVAARCGLRKPKLTLSPKDVYPR